MSENKVVLEQAAQEFADANASEPFIYQLPPEQGREILEDVQSGEGVAKPEINDEWITVEGGPTGQVPVRIVRPAGATGGLPVIFYIHGAGWVFGSANTHDRLVRELAVRTGAAVVFPEYDRAPEAKYPTAIEQNYAAARWVVEHGGEKDLDGSRMAVCGDSVGGNMSAVLALMCKDRGEVELQGQVLLYPVTDADFDTGSYHEFATGYFLNRDGMIWFWDQYTTDPGQRAQVYASPLRAPLDRLRGLPPAMVLNGEADVLRDEGEAYANRLREAGVPVTAVRFQGMIHDFMMIDSMRDTHANTTALLLATDFLADVLEARSTVPRQQAGQRTGAYVR
ncbi:alpha/beta hydrolase [Streptomonospora salina]|uniref:Acetyl esterase/lipase n=1 Tax=Streptomonospora salina TaxID=104205 RepID=A0A841E7J9_9ACTN|nr:alpha/beta hydrolase [Streptomonospora salina]MBB5999917.1 acetyl esterase/lipase [Streptomonospora salina]